MTKAWLKNMLKKGGNKYIATPELNEILHM